MLDMMSLKVQALRCLEAFKLCKCSGLLEFKTIVLGGDSSTIKHHACFVSLLAYDVEGHVLLSARCVPRN